MFVKPRVASTELGAVTSSTLQPGSVLAKHVGEVSERQLPVGVGSLSVGETNRTRCYDKTHAGVHRQGTWKRERPCLVEEAAASGWEHARASPMTSIAVGGVLEVVLS